MSAKNLDIYWHEPLTFLFGCMSFVFSASLWSTVSQQPTLLSFSAGPSPATRASLLWRLLLMKHQLPLTECLSTLSNVLQALCH